jgi:hypothetical protein
LLLEITIKTSKLAGAADSGELVMSMELFVILATTHAPDVDAWNKSLATASVPVILETTDLARHTGFLPATLRDKKTGISFMQVSYSQLTEDYPAVATIKVEEPVVYTLGYGGDWLEAATAFYAASVLVSKYGGTSFEPQGGIVMDAQALLEAARQCEEEAQTRSDDDGH